MNLLEGQLLESTELHARDALPSVMLRKAFDHADQIAFAEMSHDWNPMHTDPVLARRFLSGTQVVHGVNLLLTAINVAVGFGVRHASVIRVTCDFKVAVNLGDEVAFVLFENSTERAVINVTLGDVICTRISLYFGEGAPLTCVTIPAETLIRTNIGILDAPWDLPEGAYKDFTAQVCIGDAAVGFESLYPRLVSPYGNFLCRAFSSLSYIVGMVCPGLHSIFLSLDVIVSNNWASERNIKFRVKKVEDRVKLLELELESGCLSGQIKAFRRPNPVVQPGIAEVASYVRSDEFKHVRSFVIGGSRGLGELTSKIICAGGGKVILGYAVGEADAMRVRDDIENSRPGMCGTRQFDIRSDISSELMHSLKEIDSVYYFPTPRIFKKINSVFDQEIFRDFLDHYVLSFYRLCEQFENAKRVIKIYYPSTIAIDDRPVGMTEYAMAKAAGELMSADINRTFHYVKIHYTRLPRLNSDQTNSIFQIKSSENMSYLLSLTREMHGL